MLRREIALVLFTTAFVSLGYFARDIFPEMVAGNWGVIVGSIVNSLFGLIASFVVLLVVGGWFLWDSKKEKEKSKHDNEVILKSIKGAVKEGIYEAIENIRVKYRGGKIWRITTKRMK
jgi:uncharacterized membrane protein